MSRFGVAASLTVLAVALAAGCRGPAGAVPPPTAILKGNQLIGPDGGSLVAASAADKGSATEKGTASPCAPSASASPSGAVPKATATPAPTPTPNDRKTALAVSPSPSASPTLAPVPCE